ncbi:50S ribosomal protein L3 [bacterium]|nr:MAG: 50S ribosomal protein L3 [bacterium]
MESSKSTSFILGIKLGMSQIFNEKGRVVPVTLIHAGPCPVIQVKNKKTDGYDALQLGFLSKKKMNKPMKGHLSKQISCSQAFRYTREFRLDTPLDLRPQTIIRADVFQKGDKVKISGVSKAKGFQGTVKRHNFKGASATHGVKHAHRQPGSIGSTDAARVFKGKKMSGRMGADTVTIRNIKIVDVQEKDNLLVVKGAVPGNINGLLKIIKTN